MSVLRSSLVAGGVSALVLLVGGSGLFAVTSSTASTSLVRMGFAAGLLALFAAAAAVVVVPASMRTPVRRWSWSLAVPVLVAVATAVLVGIRAGIVPGLLAGAPWLLGALVGALSSSLLPDLSWSTWRARRQDQADRRA
ncbi:MAG: hypothetical protein ACRYG2_25070 [Janthinobacterium lividum]